MKSKLSNCFIGDDQLENINSGRKDGCGNFAIKGGERLQLERRNPENVSAGNFIEIQWMKDEGFNDAYLPPLKIYP